MSPSDRPRRLPLAVARLLAIGLGLGFVAVVLVMLEFAAGLTLAEPEVLAGKLLPADTVEAALRYVAVNPTPIVADPVLMWRNEPNARRVRDVNPRPLGTKPTWSIEINSQGFRGPELGAGNASEVYRVLCIGDSITFGFNADQPDTYPQQLAALLRARHPNQRIEVVNAGVPGWSWLQGLQFLEKRGLALAPDLVIMGHGTNDQFFFARTTDEERMHVLGNSWRVRLRDLLAMFQATNLYRAFVPQSVFSAPAIAKDEELSPGCSEQIRQTGACRRVALEQISDAVHKASALVRATGGELLVINSDFIVTSAVHASRRAAESATVPFFDAVATLDSLRRLDEGERAARLGLSAATAQNPPAAWPAAGSTRKVVFRVLVRDAARRYRVEAKQLLTVAPIFGADMADDGTGGDEKPGDLVFSATLDLPANVGAFEHQYYVDGVADFEPLPPVKSTMGWRLLAAPGDGFAPVDPIGEQLFMAERTHPNRNGLGKMAELIADKLAGMESFRRLTGDSPAR